MSRWYDYSVDEIEMCCNRLPEFEPDVIESVYWTYCTNSKDSDDVADYIEEQFTTIKERVQQCADETGYDCNFLMEMINESFLDNYDGDVYLDYSLQDFIRNDVNYVITVANELDF